MFWKRFTLRLEARCKWLYHHTNQDILEDTLLVRESCSGCPHILPTRTLCSPHPHRFHPNGQSRRWIEKLVKVFIIYVSFLIGLLIVADYDEAQADLQDPRSSGRLHTSFARELSFTAGLSLPQRERHFACCTKIHFQIFEVLKLKSFEVPRPISRRLCDFEQWFIMISSFMGSGGLQNLLI